MSEIHYFKLIGARAYQEKVNRKIDPGFPLAVSFQDSILDCDEHSFKDGVRPGDTIRQARLASPLCKIVPVSDPTSNELKHILDAFATMTPFIEPDTEGCGIFVEIPVGKPLDEGLALLDGMFHIAVVAKSRSKFLAKAGSVWTAQKLFRERKIRPGKKPWGYVETGANYISIDIKQGKEAVYSAGLPLSLLWPLPPDVISHLYALGFSTFKDLQQMVANRLTSQIGDWAYPVIDWVNGRDCSRVKQLYPKPYIEKAIPIENPMADFTPRIFEPALREVSEQLIQSGTGFKHLTITLSGPFKPVVRERKAVRPVCRLDSLKTLVSQLFEEMLSELSHEVLCRISAVSLIFKDIDRVPVAQMALGQSVSRNTAETCVSLERALTGIEQKYGDSALIWGHKHSKVFKPEILRREKMLAFWDPVRFCKTQMPAG
ncbi:MAG: hypothetical protein GX784_02875 [Firmicutes bacterium]|jgi:hypothetical protein|nr:hypothetical protein [Candidatus Fermentithermobacillaceae bacterium]